MTITKMIEALISSLSLYPLGGNFRTIYECMTTPRDISPCWRECGYANEHTTLFRVEAVQ